METNSTQCPVCGQAPHAMMTTVLWPGRLGALLHWVVVVLVISFAAILVVAR